MRPVLLLVLALLETVSKHGSCKEERAFANQLKAEIQSKYPL